MTWPNIYRNLKDIDYCVDQCQVRFSWFSLASVCEDSHPRKVGNEFGTLWVGDGRN